MLNKIALLLVVVGGVNWGLIGAADINLVNMLFGNWAWLERAVYVVVGLSALWTAKDLA